MLTSHFKQRSLIFISAMKALLTYQFYNYTISVIKSEIFTVTVQNKNYRNFVKKKSYGNHFKKWNSYFHRSKLFFSSGTLLHQKAAEKMMEFILENSPSSSTEFNNFSPEISWWTRKLKLKKKSYKSRSSIYRCRFTALCRKNVASSIFRMIF